MAEHVSRMKLQEVRTIGMVGLFKGFGERRSEEFGFIELVVGVCGMAGALRI